MNRPEALERVIPPYLPYRTFKNFVDSLRQAIPARIDRTLMRSFSGQIQTQMLNALRYLQLIDPEDRPSDRLVRLVHAEGPERQSALREVIESGYPFFREPGFSLTAITPGQLDGHFKSLGASGDTARKSITFFLAAVEDAEIPSSPYLKKARSRETNGTRLRRSVTGRSDKPRVASPGPIPATPASEQPASISWEQMLLSKFPSFDPTWPDDVKVKWFDAFDKLMNRNPTKEDRGDSQVGVVP